MILDNVAHLPIEDLDEVLESRFSAVKSKHLPFQVAMEWGVPLESPLYVILDALWRPSVNSTFTAQEMLFQIKWAIAQYEQEGVDVSRNIRTV